ncbi:metallopeptidase TldD-related protein [Cetobacterium sp.]|uniref:metallopeptidase TldD-related protein n=1 Tax=Cetobacterium sp. TaxID=2071632 RepID=UPI003F2F5A4D
MKNFKNILNQELFISKTLLLNIEITPNYEIHNKYLNEGVAARTFKSTGVGFSSKEVLTEDSLKDVLKDSNNNILKMYTIKMKGKHNIENNIKNFKISNMHFEKKEFILKEVIKVLQSRDIEVDKIIYQENNLIYNIINSLSKDIYSGTKNTCTLEIRFKRKELKEVAYTEFLKEEFDIDKVLNNLYPLRVDNIDGLNYINNKKYKIIFDNIISGHLIYVFTYLLSSNCLEFHKDFYLFIKEKKIKDTIKIIENSTNNKRLKCKYDMEGTARKPVEIFGDGKLKNIFTDIQAAEEFEYCNTASSFRSDILSYPSAMATSIEVTNGNETKIIKSVGDIKEDYIMINEIVGGEAGINYSNGNINIVCNGYIGNGDKKGEIIKIYIETSMLDFFNNIVSMTKDKYYFSDCHILTPFIITENIKYTKI